MAKCFNCGREYEGNFCPDCGTENPNAADMPSVSETSQQNYSAPPPPPQRYTPPPVYNNVAVVNNNDVTSVGGWIGWMFLLSLLPLIGVIIMLCCTHDESAKNFAKAQLFFMLLGVGIVVLVIILALVLGAASSY